ncbi:MAG: hypothetical protein D6788_10860 [Planctomycetota bacterium]|nr:MAG: hypothetical protein D6788_10860 [Planctomycetota bacterium]
MIVLVAWTGPVLLAGQGPPEPKKTDKTDRRLGERLIREAGGDREEDVMDRVLRLMDESAKRLAVAFDPGAETRRVQREILESLDRAIKKAASQRRMKRSRKRGRSADKRRMAAGSSKSQGSDASAGKTVRALSPSGMGPPQPGDAEEPVRGGRFREGRRAWGHLPQREREEILQGMRERFLERYRTWIERYFRALQEEEPEER